METNTPKYVLISCTGSAECGSKFTTAASQSFDFDASKYVYCYVSGSYKFRGGSGSATTITLQKEELTYNADGPVHEATEQSQWNSRLLYTASTFNIQLQCTIGSATIGRVTFCQLTAVFQNS